MWSKTFFYREFGLFKELEISQSDFALCQKFIKEFTQNPLDKAVEFLKQGKILAVKGIGGYALVCNGLNTEAIMTLRMRKIALESLLL